MSGKVCLDRFCYCHGHMCHPDQLAEEGAIWVCPSRHCRMVWTCEPSETLPAILQRYSRGGFVMQGHRPGHPDHGATQFTHPLPVS